jgi:MFS family permease
MMISLLIFGILSDRFGRKKIIVIKTLITIVLLITLIILGFINKNSLISVVIPLYFISLITSNLTTDI